MFRMVSENAAKHGVVTASSTAGALVAANMLTDIMTQQWRGAGTTETIRIVWPAPVLIGCVAPHLCNLTSLATMRVRGNAIPGAAVPLIDTGVRLACPGGGASTRWGLGANSYAFGGGAAAVAWIEHTAVRELVIDLVDPTNPAGYIEVSRLLAGAYFAPEEDPEYGSPWTPADTSTLTRNAAGDAIPTVRFRINKASVSLKNLTLQDRGDLMDAIRNNGKSVPHFVSQHAEHEDGRLERDSQIYGHIVNDPGIYPPSFGVWATTLEMESA